MLGEMCQTQEHKSRTAALREGSSSKPRRQKGGGGRQGLGDEESVSHGDSFRIPRGRVLETEGGDSCTTL